MKVLFVGADPNTATKVDLAVRLRWPDSQILLAADGNDDLGVIEQQQPDLVLFQSDQFHPSVETFIEGLRAFSDVPLVVLEPEPEGGYMEEVKALESGADDYIRASAGIIDLVARLVALIRRTTRMDISKDSERHTNGALSLDPTTYEVFLKSERLTLTSTEFRLLHLLMDNRSNVVSHGYIARSLWGDHVDSSALVKKYVQRLRRKLHDDPQNPKWIANVHGVGYRILGAPQSATVEERTAV
jgi:DNA-binding response OmpR family regulator